VVSLSRMAWHSAHGGTMLRVAYRIFRVACVVGVSAVGVMLLAGIVQGLSEEQKEEALRLQGE
jgi:hypothetical protein